MGESSVKIVLLSSYQEIIVPAVHDAILFWLQSIAVQGYETGEHAPGVKLKGTGAYKAAHNIIKVNTKL